MVAGGFKLVRVKNLYDAFLPTGSNGSLTGLTTVEDLDVHHVVLLLAHLRVVVDSAIEN